MRSLIFTVVSSLLLLTLLSPFTSGEISIFNDHISPRDPEVGDELEIFVTVRDTGGVGINSVKCRIGNDTVEMEIFTLPEQEELNWTQGVLYSCMWKVQGGHHNISYLLNDTYGNLTFVDTPTLFIEGDDKAEDTIFGLPKTYCAISVIFITLIIIFLTWSYFKGRKMQKEMVDNTGSSMMSCSACGSKISPTDEKCPKCGVQFDDEEHVCGGCGEVISPEDGNCPKCGTRLKKARSDRVSDPLEKKDRDLEKLGKNVDMKGKIRCANCGSVYLKKEKNCPECQEE